jgi:hypothetical protein
LDAAHLYLVNGLQRSGAEAFGQRGGDQKVDQDVKAEENAGEGVKAGEEEGAMRRRSWWGHYRGWGMGWKNDSMAVVGF